MPDPVRRRIGRYLKRITPQAKREGKVKIRRMRNMSEVGPYNLFVFESLNHIDDLS
jgi:hypothetical protein